MQAELVTARNKRRRRRQGTAALTEGDDWITQAHMAQTAQSNNSREEMKAGVLSLSQSPQPPWNSTDHVCLGDRCEGKLSPPRCLDFCLTLMMSTHTCWRRCHSALPWINRSGSGCPALAERRKTTAGMYGFNLAGKMRSNSKSKSNPGPSEWFSLK